MIALDSDESGWTEADGDKSELADFMTQMLVSKRQLLDDYFSLEIDEDGLLHTVPLLLQVGGTQKGLRSDLNQNSTQKS